MLNNGHRHRLLQLIAATLLCTSVLAQANSTKRSRLSRRQEKPANTAIEFGDIRLFGYSHLQFRPGEFATAEGPNTVIEALDEQNKARSRMQASRFHAIMNAKEQKVERVDATGGVKYNGVRPIAGREGQQVVDFSGSKGTYFKMQGKVLLEGPVAYYVEQPDPKAGKQWARGIADKGSYDENKKILRLDGHVRFTYLFPSASGKQQGPVEVEYVEIDMSAASPLFKLGPGIVTFEPKSPKGNP